MSSPPPLSIIITTRDPKRRPYLTEAIRSCIAQDFPPASYEIVVVSAYPLGRDSLPPSAAPLSVVTSSGAWQGGRIAAGARAARGTHLVLMDDDDLFEPRKLARLAEVLGQAPDLSYYHNECILIDPTGAPLGRSTFHRSTARFKGPGYFGPHDEGQKQREAGSMVRAFAFFNPSSIVVSRALVEQGAALLDQVTAAPDLVLFFLALATPGTVYLDDAVLTRYRIHPGNESILNWPDMPLDFRTRVVETLGMVQSHCGPKLPPKAREIIGSMILSGSFGIAILSGRANHGEVSRAMWRLLRERNASDRMTRFGSVPLAYAYMVNPGVAQWWLRTVRVRDMTSA
jgi:glycosyltransferase involved in cell wall biosynthesis